jgi:hypothetical protein
MFSPAEYLTNLHQISLLSGLVTPLGQLPSIPKIPQLQSAPGGIPVVATVPSVPSATECNDIIRAVASSPLAINLAATFTAAFIITILIKKYGPSILGWFRDKMQNFLASIRSKISKRRSNLLQPSVCTVVVMG